MSKVVDHINDLIVSGRSDAAKRAIREAMKKPVRERADRLRMANLARRVGLPIVSLRLLNALVRPTSKQPEVATPEEKAEYAAALTFIGASEESIVLLESLPHDTVPQSLLFEAFAYFSRWEYRAAIPLLREYILSSKITDYQKLVGRVNLLAALVFEELYKECETLQAQILDEAKRGGYTLLYGNTLELAAQVAIFQRNFTGADETLKQAREVFSQADSLDSFFVKKWSSILALMKKKSAESRAAVIEVRNDALTRHHWETVRECERFLAVEYADVDLMKKVYYGTPYSPYRERLVRDFQRQSKVKLTLPDTFSFELEGPKGPRLEVDVADGTFIYKEKPLQLKVGQALHRLLVSLSSDLYRPLRVAVAHHYLYPDEYFHPLSSPHRVYEVVRRLKGWFQKKHLPLHVEERTGFYELKTRSAATLVLPRAAALSERKDSLSRILFATWKREKFSANDAAASLKISRRSVLRVLEKACQDGVLEREGKARATKYCFKK